MINRFQRRARLLSGLVLVVFVTAHLANLSLGLISLQSMEEWRGLLMAPWHTFPGILLLSGAALVHVVCGLYTFSARRSLVFSRTDLVQLLLGTLTPFLLISHVLAMRATGAFVEQFNPSYGLILSVYWEFMPSYAFQQILVVVVVWVHAAIGLYGWLVLRPSWPRLQIVVLPLLFGVPILALLGFAEAGKEVVLKLARDPVWQAEIQRNAGSLASVQERLGQIQAYVLATYAALVVAAASLFGARAFKNRNNPVTVAYDEGFMAQGRRGLSILEISRLNKVPHAHVCSGRGNCGTCRVRVISGLHGLSRKDDHERRTLAAFDVEGEVRLACQALVMGDVAVIRVLPAYADASATRSPAEWSETEQDGQTVGSDPLAGAPA